MHRIQFIHPPPLNRVLQRRAFIFSCVFHGSLLFGLLGLTIYWRTHLPPPSGSAAGATAISLQTMVIVSNPPEPPLPSSPTLPPISMPTTDTSMPLHNSIVPIKVPEMGEPVLPTVPSKSTVAKAAPVHHTKTTHTTTESPKAAAAAVASSYSPGANVLPHPPYPSEARSLGESGTVIMYVQFDSDGNVATAKITRSSGVPVLDTETKSFIREHWHSAEYAGQSISQPVEYSLETHL